MGGAYATSTKSAGKFGGVDDGLPTPTTGPPNQAGRSPPDLSPAVLFDSRASRHRSLPQAGWVGRAMGVERGAAGCLVAAAPADRPRTTEQPAGGMSDC